MELKEIREEINTVDQQLLHLFLQRMTLSEQIAGVKSASTLPIENRAREREILGRVTDEAGSYAPYAFQLFTMLMELSKARQSELLAAPSQVRSLVERARKSSESVFPRMASVACQGTEGGNSQAACDKLFPMGKIVYVKSFEAVCNAVESGLCRYGVLPIENSSNGSVRSVYELLTKKQFSIVRGTSLCIRHELLAKPGVRMDQITQILSHEQALGQCSRFLSGLGHNVQILPCANTAVAARTVAQSEDPHVAAIASHACAGLYGLQVLNDAIQDSENNYTRFVCITKDPMIYPGSNRISLILGCANEPGALNGILGKLAARGVNMSKLESCPVTGRNFEFQFFLELDASLDEPGVLPMLEELERTAESFVFLGNYAMV